MLTTDRVREIEEAGFEVKEIWSHTVKEMKVTEDGFAEFFKKHMK